MSSRHHPAIRAQSPDLKHINRDLIDVIRRQSRKPGVVHTGWLYVKDIEQYGPTQFIDDQNLYEIPDDDLVSTDDGGHSAIFYNGWSNSESVWQPMGVMKETNNNIVRMVGFIDNYELNPLDGSCDGTVITVLPEAYRPRYPSRWTFGWSNAHVFQMQINCNGIVSCIKVFYHAGDNIDEGTGVHINLSYQAGVNPDGQSDEAIEI